MADPVEIGQMSRPDNPTTLKNFRLIRGTHDVPASVRGAIVAIGNFDGVHRGHQALISNAIAASKTAATPAGVIVFDPHPRALFQPDADHFQLSTLDAKVCLLASLGLDLCVVLKFDRALASLSAEEFISNVLVRDLSVAGVIVGYDFHFGKGRGGSPETLRAAGKRHGFQVTVVEPQSDSGEVFSSTAVRELLIAGHVASAAEMLGYNWFVTGKVKPGAGRGAGLGFPTANIDMPRGTRLGHGIYAVEVEVASARYFGAAYFGSRPTFDDGAPVLEVFVFDFDGDLYGADVKISFVEFLRGDTRFDDADSLKAQITADCERARKILKQRPVRRLPA